MRRAAESLNARFSLNITYVEDVALRRVANRCSDVGANIGQSQRLLTFYRTLTPHLQFIIAERVPDNPPEYQISSNSVFIHLLP